MNFKSLGIIDPILKALERQGYETPTPIQEMSIPVLLEKHDVLASAQTGTGKTASFAIPIIQGLYGNPSLVKPRIIRTLVLAPTRELAEQIKDSFRLYSHGMDLKTDVVYGGVSQHKQELSVRRGLDILVATPGRLLDLVNQGIVKLNHVEYFVLDEADRMLDMGFIRDVRKIVSYIKKERQTMLFSATMPNEILTLAHELLNDPKRIEITPREAMIDKIDQSVYYVAKSKKVDLLIDLLVNPFMRRVLVFTRTKNGANRLVKALLAYGVKADAIHGNKSQNQRTKALQNFKNNKLRVLVATDIAARGIDVDDLTHVVNYDLPETPETYVHRIGRTGRAGQSGIALSFCSQEEAHLLQAIHKHNKMMIPLVSKQPFHIEIRFGQTKNEVKQLKGKGSQRGKSNQFGKNKRMSNKQYSKNTNKKNSNHNYRSNRSKKK
ncbi:DEAD/DEAH box helicase [Mycoplasmatota bacterium]|nr:DEAD/DEAH box helicase [Mycoplasmatota bacterium]